MNYRHAFHAGNFADVMKHATLARILEHLRRKDAGFCVLDTHAGAGLYDLRSDEAQRGGEWRAGIARLRAATLRPEVASLLAPYRDAIESFNGAATELKTYPGSPAIVRLALRLQDRLIACELEPGAAALLRRTLSGDPRTKAVAIDGWTALNAYVPPKEKRGLVLIDPPFEQPDEFSEIMEALAQAYRKWPAGIYAIWYPVKNIRACAAFARKLQQQQIAKILRAELHLTSVPDPERLHASGLIVVNPPWTLERELAILLPALAEILSPDRKGATRLDWLADEKTQAR
ncbi:MAG: 23S rRNA (adenine(2030)-N(6))-methyltransferase RlmJ [Pseudorhodoplanes sp.]